MAAQLGSGLGDQSVIMDKTVKTALSRSSNTRVKVAVELQDSGVNARNEKGRTTLHFACGMASSVTARSLVEAGADVNARDQDGWTPLLVAADGGFANCVQLLLDNGANPNAVTDNINKTALIAAAYKGHFECLRILMKYGASINAKTKWGLTALIAAADSVEGCSGACVQALLQVGGEVNAKTSEGTTALIHAVSNNFGEVVEALLDAGSEVNAVDGKGYSALHYGALNNSIECIQTLLDRGADETRKYPPGRAPLEMAPRDTEGARLLEESWKKLELTIAMRAEELLLEDKLERQFSVASPKPSTQHARKKKKVKKNKKKKQEEVVEEANYANKDCDSKDLESSPSRVQDGTISLPKTPPEVEAKVGEATEHEHEETWMKHVERLELELEQARQVVQEKVKQLETAETTKTVMETRIYHLEEALKSNEISNI